MKKFLVSILTLSLVLSMAVCGYAQSDENSQAGPTVGANVVLADPSYSAMSADELYELAKAEDDTIVIYSETSKMSKAVDKFLADYPEVKVEHYTLTPSEIQEKVETENATGNVTADVVVVNDAAGTIYNEWYEDGYVEAYYPADIIANIPEEKLHNALPLYEALNIWFYNNEQFPDGSPITNWWDIVEVDESGKQAYRIFCKNISSDTSYMSFYANMMTFSAEMEKAYEDKYGTPLEYTYDPTVVPVEANNAAYEFLYRFAQLEVGFIPDGDEIVQAVAEGTEPTLGFATANKLDQRDENNWPIAWVTQMAPYASTSNPKNVYLITDTKNPAGARLLIHYLMGGENGDTPALDQFARLGTWFMRSDYVDEANEIMLDEISIVELNTEAVYDSYLDINDFWIYWSDFFAK
ncbi:MAG: hypothetical protein GX096_10070 [Clostridiales bacterium]|nr:hypothetical protein [Clostridiales bacterium]